MAWSLRKLTSPKPLPCAVIVEPYRITKKDFKEGHLEEGVPEYSLQGYFQEASDKRLVINLTHDKTGLIMYGSFFLLMACIGLFVKDPDPDMNAFATVLGGIALLLSLPFFLYLKYRPERLLIFDREKQLVTLPFRVWGKNETLPLCQIYATETYSPLPRGGSVCYLTLIRTDNVPVLILCHDGMHMQQLWSLFVWYMDLNRPLPHGVPFLPSSEPG